MFSMSIQALFFLLFPVLLLSSCSSLDKNADTPEGAFAIAESFEKDERYEIAIQRYQEIKNKYPYSQFAMKSELAIADVYFKQESYAEAQVSYQSFRDLHPKHPKIDYVIFRIALSYYHQVPEAIDRDLSLAHDAIAYFKEIEEKYSRQGLKSEYTKEAEDKHLELLKKLAGKEEYIGDFYMKRKIWESALVRYEGLLKKYQKLGYDEKALSKAAICAYEFGDAQKAHKLLAELEKNYPNSEEISQAKKVVR
jgi:outer membrane protein assembly factor BamD